MIPGNQRPAMRLAACALALFALNAVVVWELFFVEFTQHMFNVDGAFMAAGRRLAEHPSEVSWWPFWNLGMPFHHAYLPGLTVAIALFVRLTGASAALAYHAVTAFFYCLAPATLFFMAYAMSRRLATSLYAGLLFSLLSPSIFLIPVIREDIGSVWNARRLQALAYYGGGPEIMALALAPLALLFLHLALEHRRKWQWITAGLLMAATVLTNAFGAVTLALGVVCLLLARPMKEWPNAWLRTIVLSIPAYLLISPWLPPSFLRVIAENSQTSGGDYRWNAGSVIAMAITLLSAGGAAALTRRLPMYLRFFGMFATVLTSITLLGMKTGWHAIPQPIRYHIEMEMTLCVVAAFAGAALIRRLPPTAQRIAAAAFVLALIPQAVNYTSYSRGLFHSIDIRETSEYRTARMLERHFGGQRVMVAGSPTFWFNVFTDTPQLGGGHDPFMINWYTRIAVHVLYTGQNLGERDGEICALWLKALGARGINVPGPDSEEYYKPFRRNPALFEGILQPLETSHGDTIYEIPARSASLAHVVPEEAIITKPPIHGLDVEQVERYVNALDDEMPPLASSKWNGTDAMEIEADVAPGQAISVQINAHDGWRATSNGKILPVENDGLGMIVLRPPAGRQRIELTFDGGGEATATRALSFLTTLSLLAWVTLPYIRGRMFSPHTKDR